MKLVLMYPKSVKRRCKVSKSRSAKWRTVLIKWLRCWGLIVQIDCERCHFLPRSPDPKPLEFSVHDFDKINASSSATSEIHSGFEITHNHCIWFRSTSTGSLAYGKDLLYRWTFEEKRKAGTKNIREEYANFIILILFTGMFKR